MAPVALQKAILATLTYSDHFSFPLTLSEISTRLIGVQLPHPQVADQIQVMLESGHIQKTGKFYHLPGRAMLVGKRQRREKVSTPQRSQAMLLTKKLGRIPGILGIYLTGSLAVNNSEGGDDLDLLVITKNDRLWQTRFLLTLYCELLGLRRRPHMQAVAGKVCLNLYLTPKAFALPESKRSLYTAYELIQAVPLYDPAHLHTQLLSANAWLKAYLPNYKIPQQKTKIRPLLDEGQIFWSAIETVSYKLQTWYMREKRTREYITQDVAFFHPQNPGSPVLQKLKSVK